MVALAESGFTQEIGILFRAVYEAYTQIEAVMAQIRKDGHVTGEVATFIADYFADNKRRTADHAKRSNLSQRTVNELIGAQLDPFSPIVGDDPEWKSAAERLANLNHVFSNYVHGRYPETAYSALASLATISSCMSKRSLTGLSKRSVQR
jgi:hypothetical protein